MRCSTRLRSSGGQCPTRTIFLSSAAIPGRTRTPVAKFCGSGRPFFGSGGAFQAEPLRRRALAQKRNETLLRHRLAQQISLAVVASHAHQCQGVRGLFDADRDDIAAETVSEIDDGLAQRSVDLVGAALGDEGLVEL